MSQSNYNLYLQGYNIPPWTFKNSTAFRQNNHYQNEKNLKYPNFATNKRLQGFSNGYRHPAPAKQSAIILLIVTRLSDPRLSIPKNKI